MGMTDDQVRGKNERQKVLLETQQLSGLSPTHGGPYDI